MKRLLILPLLLLAPLAWGDLISYEVCVINGETMQTVTGADIAISKDGDLLFLGATNMEGCVLTDYGPITQSGIEVDIHRYDYMPWYGYPEWSCEVVYPVSPPYVNCYTNVFIVPREQPFIVFKTKEEK